jgi:uncharacterized protein
MVFYLDTCVILSAVQADAHSENVDAWLNVRRTSELVTSVWMLTEAASALGRLVRMNDLTPEAAMEKYRDIQIWLADGFHVEDATPSDFSAAAERQTTWSLGLRAGDALHLAVAARIGAILVTTDDTLARACVHHNVAVQSPC